MKIKTLSFVALLFIISAFTTADFKIIDSKKANKMLSGKTRYVVLDVRTEMEYKSGHIKGSVNIDISKADFYEKINKLNKNAKYIVYCRTKNRSQMAVEYMFKNGFKEVYKMQDGISGWIANGLPIE